MSASDFPTSPTKASIKINLETDEVLPEIPDGYFLRVIVEIEERGHMWHFERNVLNQKQYDAYRLMAKHPEVKSIFFILLPLIPQSPRTPKEFANGVDISDLNWEDLISD